MANGGPNTNGSQFFIIFKRQPHLDGYSVLSFARLPAYFHRFCKLKLGNRLWFYAELFSQLSSGDRKHVVFGNVVSGMDVVKKMEELGTADGRPSGLVKITDCGEMPGAKIHESAVVDKGTELVRLKRLFSAFMSN